MSIHTVHVRVNDAASGQPTPVRIRFTGPNGETFAPLGRLVEFTTARNQEVGGNLLLGKKAYAYIDGSCEIRLPAGPILVEIYKGPEYRPIHQELTLSAGKLALRFALERWIDTTSEGWYSGDIRAHSLSPHAALLEAAAEDLAVVNLLAHEYRRQAADGKISPALSNILAFSGQRPALEMPGTMVVVNTHNTHPVLGSLGLLNCHRIVFPLSFGGADGLDDWSLADWCDQCHRKGGLVVWTKTAHEAAEFRYGEPLADMILGKIDAFEIDFFEDSVFDVLLDWYKLLNCGLRLPLAGGSGKDSNDTLLGVMRTYARLGIEESLTYRGWIEAIRAGRTFATNGPILYLTVNGDYPGTKLDLSSPIQPLTIRALAQSQVPFEKLELIVNGKVLAAAEASGSPARARIEMEWMPAASGWLAARCQGQEQIPHRPANQRVFAHTSPIYVQAEGHPFPIDEAAVSDLVRELDAMVTWVATKARCETERQRDHLAGIFRSAREELLRRTREGS